MDGTRIVMATLGQQGDFDRTVYDSNAGWGWLWSVLVTLLIIGAVAVAVWGVTRAMHGPLDAGREREVLADLHARGEISTEEYHERLRTLD
jgi:uncharacterized membrane protein